MSLNLDGAEPIPNGANGHGGDPREVPHSVEDDEPLRDGPTSWADQQRPVREMAEPAKSTGFMDGLWPLPGVVGEVARWVHQSMPLPDRGAAVAVALAAVASANRNRHFVAGPLGPCALNIYVVCADKTG